MITDEELDNIETMCVQEYWSSATRLENVKDLCKDYRALKERVAELEKAAAMARQIVEATQELREDNEAEE